MILYTFIRLFIFALAIFFLFLADDEDADAPEATVTASNGALQDRWEGEDEDVAVSSKLSIFSLTP